MENQVSANEIAVEADASDAVAENEVSFAAENAVPPKKKKRHINQQKLQDNIWGWVFCLPLIVGTVWFVYSALIMAIMLSFTGYTLSSGSLTQYLANLGDHIYTNAAAGSSIDPVTGALISGGEATPEPFHWYAQIFTKTLPNIGGSGLAMHEMGIYLFNTVFYMIGIPIGMVLAMFFAVCMSRDIKGGSVFRVLYYIPCVASTISIVFTFKLMFQQSGVINQILGTDHISWLVGNASWNSLHGKNSTSNFMQNPYWCQGFLSKMVIVIMSVWKGLGGTIILYVAGLSGVNQATKEAAQIDGANAWKIFWKVTMPDLYPVIFYNIVTSVIGGLQIYAEPELFLPNNNAMVAGYVGLVYKYGIGGSGTSPAAGAAYGLFLAVIIFVLTLFQFWLDSRKKD
ncbi:MAG: sugar ABC transporter permease [Clostridia bacterium]|nr:sugar ABC transporter permease [Clostridia bacterium]